MASAVNTQEHSGRFGQSGFEARVHFTDKFSPGGIAIILQGGLGDASSQSVRELVDPVLEVSDGEIAVATVGTKRPSNPFTAIKGLTRARIHQSQSAKGASDWLNNTIRPGSVVLSGQSRGGVSATDAAHYLACHPMKNAKSPRVSVVTIDTPGVFGPLRHDGSLIDGLIRLGWHCMEDFTDLRPMKQAVFLARAAKKVASFEIPYFLADVAYLHDINLKPHIDDLRTAHNIPVYHIFHRGDLIPGAEQNSEFSIHLDGGHARFMVEPEPVAAALYTLSTAVHQNLHAA